MIVDRQTHRHAHHSTLLPYLEWSNELPLKRPHFGNLFLFGLKMRGILQRLWVVSSVQTAEILFFVIDNQTRSLASIIEAAYLAGAMTSIDWEFVAYCFKIRKNSRIIPIWKNFFKNRKNSFPLIVVNPVLNFKFASFKFAFSIVN